MSNLKQISKEIKSQDNGSTHEPMFVVYEKIKYPCDSDYCDDYVWVDDEGSEFTDEDLIEHLTKDLMIEKENLPDLEDEYEEKIIVEGYEYDKWYYQEIPRFKQIFFTRLAAQEYIDNNHYNLTDPYIYVHSLYRNYEMIEIRKHLENLE